MAFITNNPNFNKLGYNQYDGGLPYSSPGFYSRVLFTYAPYNNNIDELSGGNNTSDWFVNSSFNGIASLGSDISHGSNVIPAYYWRPGKTIKITGGLSINVPGQTSLGINRRLNLRFGLISGSFAEPTAIQNNNNNHVIPNDATTYNFLPVHFECTIACSTINTSADEITYYSNGFYYYDYIGYNTLSTNFPAKQEIIYVPVWNAPNLSKVLSASDYYENPTSIMMNMYDSALGNGTDGYGECYLTKLLIEELA